MRPARRAAAGARQEQAALALQREVEQLLTLDINVTAVEAQRALAALAEAERAVRPPPSTRTPPARLQPRADPASGVVTAIGLNALGKAGYLQALFSYHNARANLKRATADRETPYGY